MSIYTTLSISRQKALELYHRVHSSITNEQLESFIEEYCMEGTCYNCMIIDNPNYKDDTSQIFDLFDAAEKAKTVPFTFAYLERKLGWSVFCELTNTDEWCRNEGFDIRPEAVYYIKESDVRKHNL